MAKKFKYRAFLSYSHDDREWGETFHKAVERYRVPKDLVGRTGRHGRIRGKLRPIFRDRFDLEAGHSLNEQILAALENSESLIVACSPASAQSPYVNEEIRQFKMAGRADRILPIIVGGIPGDEKLDPFPPMLTAALDAEGRETGATVEPLAADARAEGDGQELAVQKIVAGLLGVDLDELRQREKQDEKRRRRFWIGVASLMLVLAVFAGIAAMLARERQHKVEGLVANMMTSAGELVTSTVRASRERGVPVAVSVGFLSQAANLIKTVEDSSSEQSDEVRYQRGVMHLSFADSYMRLSKLAQHRSHARKGHAIMAELEIADPSNPRWQFGLSEALVRVGRGYEARGDNERALKRYREALAIKLEKLKDGESEDRVHLAGLADVYERIAQIHHRRGQLDPALDHTRSRMAIVQRLAERFPDGSSFDRLAHVYIKLADMHRQNGDLGDARTTAASGFRVVERMESKTLVRRHSSSLHIITGDVKRLAGNTKGALGDYREAARLRKLLTIQDPTNIGWQNSHDLALVKVGEALNRLGRRKQALAAFITSKDNQEKLVALYPTNANLLRRLQDGLQGVADIQMQLRRYAEARASAERRLAVAEQLRNLDLSNEYAKARYAKAQLDLAEILFKARAYPAAREQLTESLELLQHLSDSEPAIRARKRNVATAAEFLARTESRLGRDAEALVILDRARKIRVDLVELTSNSPFRVRDLALNHYYRARIHAAMDDCNAGLAEFAAAAEKIEAAIAARNISWWKYDKQNIERHQKNLKRKCAPAAAASETESQTTTTSATAASESSSTANSANTSENKPQ